MNERQASLVCGFGDAAAGVAGLAWDLGEPGAVLLSEGEARAGTFALEEGGDAAVLEIAAGDASAEATLSSRTAEIALTSALVGGISRISPRMSVRKPGVISSAPPMITRTPS